MPIQLGRFRSPRRRHCSPRPQLLLSYIFNVVVDSEVCSSARPRGAHRGWLAHSHCGCGCQRRAAQAPAPFIVPFSSSSGFVSGTGSGSGFVPVTQGPAHVRPPLRRLAWRGSLASRPACEGQAGRVRAGCAGRSHGGRPGVFAPVGTGRHDRRRRRGRRHRRHHRQPYVGLGGCGWPSGHSRRHRPARPFRHHHSSRVEAA